MTSVSGAGEYSRDADTGIGTGKSLKSRRKRFHRSAPIWKGPTNKITIASWIKMDDYHTNYILTSFVSGSSGIKISSTGEVRFYINSTYGSDGSTSSLASPDGVIQKNKWHYVVGSYDGDTSQIKLWVDGELVASRDGVNQTISFTNKQLYVGVHPYAAVPTVWLDEVVFSSYAFDGEKLK